MDSLRETKSFLIINTVLLLLLIIFPGGNHQSNNILSIVAVITNSYAIWYNYDKVPKIYTFIRGIFVLIFLMFIFT